MRGVEQNDRVRDAGVAENFELTDGGRGSSCTLFFIDSSAMRNSATTPSIYPILLPMHVIVVLTPWDERPVTALTGRTDVPHPQAVYKRAIMLTLARGLRSVPSLC